MDKPFPEDLKENLINAVHEGELTVEFVNKYFDVKAEMAKRGLSIPDQEETTARLEEEKRRRKPHEGDDAFAI